MIPKKVQFIGIVFVMCNSNKPNHPVKGPGNTGKNEPIMPKHTNTKPISNKNISIVFLTIITVVVD